MRMHPYDPARPLVSLHVPKTGGISLRSTLIDWFGAGGLFLHYRGPTRDLPPRFDVKAGQCVHGHFNRLRGFGVHDYYPDATQFIIFLRHPFTRFISQWRHLNFQQRLGVSISEMSDNPSFATWFKRRAEATVAGSDSFSLAAQLPATPPAQDPTSAFDHGYVAIGIMENYNESVRVLADALGFPAPSSVAHLNRADDANRKDEPAADHGEWAERHREIFSVEYELYHAGRARLAIDLQRLRAREAQGAI
jgi:hypothetical protein